MDSAKECFSGCAFFAVFSDSANEYGFG
jgi:hypothetical protein